MRPAPGADTLRVMFRPSCGEPTNTNAKRAVRPRATLASLLVAALAALLAPGCSKSPSAPPASGPARSWAMGFAGIPPVPDEAVAIATIDLWSRRADTAIQHASVPWDSLLAGMPADTIVRRLELPLMRYYRLGKGLKIVYEIDPTNGLNRGAEDPALVRLGRSISEPQVQAAYRAWAAAIDTIVHPDWLGLACETNLVRLAAPPSLYAALGTLARSTAESLSAMHSRRPSLPRPVLYSSVQVETAWGRLGGGGAYVGIATDLADFPFSQVLGLSSYPYLGGFAEPEEIPLDYFSRIATDAARPVMVVEGGWPTQSYATYVTSAAEQARWVRRQAQLLDAARAIGWYGLEFADLALSQWPGTVDPSLRLFASIGFVDSALTPKPSLATWDSLFARPLAP